ncbi:phenylalanine--tRNA ligase subunit beta [Hydromonas duriensis]|uniref:Phenylalanine--tRNA ligase beta subunit n=1 Tax=Hydromonas duriensis TaxID=1527608 RepID=A0A4R6Y9Y0_9BURK|nr:phenylalanine--tRNA ligase subunit beta [Hydromonas duriensis]TDR32333.1 phenylalanyl-tRNA synthetase beta subunit [Hydromonas duriensis]
MRFSESWLREWVNPSLTTAELDNVLTMGGLEVEEATPAAPAFTGVVVGEIVSIEKHPDADKLNVCQVNVGGEALLQIVCGAPNARAGIRVPCATVGAVLPGDFKIKDAKLRGVASHGMLCSAKELGVNPDASGLYELPLDAPVGQDIRQYLNLNDTVFEIKLTPNRADCLSLRGVARDVAALTGATLTPFQAEPVAATIDDVLPIRIDAPAACGRFTGRVLKGVNAAAPTPLWMVQRLERAGVRSISALVDITNYVMLHLGQPMHVYDLNAIKGTIHARMAVAGETIELLNEQTHTLQEDVLVIADDSGAIGMAGVMGGNSTKAELSTADIFLEAAYFAPDVIQGKSRRFRFSSDASHRFERGVDFKGQVEALEFATRLVLDMCGGQAGPVLEQVGELPQREKLSMRVARAQKVIGVAIPADDMVASLNRLQLQVTRAQDAIEGEILSVTAPSYRFDMAIEEDLIEEVVRLFGYDNIPVKPPVALQTMLHVTENERALDAVRDALVGMDYQEVINFSFVDDAVERDFAGSEGNPIRLLNPIASSLAVMRTQLLGSLVGNLKTNLARSASRIRVFEIAKVFHRDATVLASENTVPNIAQPLKLAGLAYGSRVPEQWAAAEDDVDFYDVKGDIERLFAPRRVQFEAFTHVAAHPGRCAKLSVNGQMVGWLGQMHPRLQQAHDLPKAPMMFEIDMSAVLARDVPVAAEVSKLPMVTRDLALIVARDVTAGAIIEAVEKFIAIEPTAYVIRDVQLFDVYQGEHMAAHEKSMAYRVSLQDMQTTLQDAQVDALMQALLAHLQVQVNARLR